MLTKKAEFSAGILKLIGFGLFAPLGKIFLEPAEIINRFGSLYLFGYIIFGLISAYFGIIVILRSVEIMED